MASVCKRFHVKEKSKWKTVDVPSTDDFSSLVELQELSDYEFVDEEEEKKSKKKKKTKTVNTNNEENASDGVETHTEDGIKEVDESSLKKKKKRKRKRKKKGAAKEEVQNEAEAEESNEEEKGDDDSEEETAADDKEEEDNTLLSEGEGQESEEENELDGMDSWKNLGVSPILLKALKEEGFMDPTPVQALALPDAIFHKMDIIAAAETGSGKTLGFGLPMLENILNSDVSDETVKERGPCALILEPTRELAMQVHKHLKAAARHTDIKVVTVIGGMAPQKQSRLLKRHPHIIVATPGRLWEFIQEGDKHLKKLNNIDFLVLDEADRMIEKGHFEELTKIFEMLSLREANGGKRQHFIFSATLTLDHSAPHRLMKKKKKKIEAQDAKQKLEELLSQLEIGDKPKIIDLTRKEVTVDTLTETRIDCHKTEKDLYLYYILRKYGGRTLVFCNSKDCIRRLVSVFSVLGCTPLPLHSDMHQKQRLKNLDRFAEKSPSLLLASDVAARGLDIKGIDHVVHYQVPFTVENYVHRSGRTARASREGLSVILVSPDEIKMYKNILKLKQGLDLEAFPVAAQVLAVLKMHVDLATKIDTVQHGLRKSDVKKTWIQKAAEEMDIEIDEDFMGLAGEDEQETQAGERHQVKAMKAQLAALTRQPLLTSSFSTRYPTQTGALVVPKPFNQGTAVKSVKDCRKRKRPSK